MMPLETLTSLRERLMRDGFSAAQAQADPLRQFAAWFELAREAGLYQSNAMTLATATTDGRPSARMVILSAFDEGGIVFCTDRDSPKARILLQNPWAAAVVHWGELQRQVRLEGRAVPAAEAEADAYFARRRWPARLATWAGRQSQPIPDRELLEERLVALLAKYEHAPVPRPPYYAAYRLVPDMLEFWQGRHDCLHDRVKYTRAESGWRIETLAP